MMMFRKFRLTVQSTYTKNNYYNKKGFTSCKDAKSFLQRKTRMQRQDIIDALSDDRWAFCLVRLSSTRWRPDMFTMNSEFPKQKCRFNYESQPKLQVIILLYIKVHKISLIKFGNTAKKQRRKALPNRSKML